MPTVKQILRKRAVQAATRDGVVGKGRRGKIGCIDTKFSTISDKNMEVKFNDE
jgi:hypothetical protein